MPNFIKITSGTCESNGYQDLHSQHECALATGSKVRSESTNDPPFCFEFISGGVTSFWWNNNFTSTRTIDYGEMYVSAWCKE